jgi:hypothetical protein
MPQRLAGDFMDVIKYNRRSRNCAWAYKYQHRAVWETVDQRRASLVEKLEYWLDNNVPLNISG